VNRLPIRLRLAFVFGLVLAVVFTTVGAFLYFRLGATLDERIADSLESRSSALATVLRGDAGGSYVDPALIAGEDGVAQVIGSDGSVVVAKILDTNDNGFGFDAQTCEFGDLIARGIIDPAKVVRSALQGAASIAGLLITTEAMVAEVPGPPPPELPGHHDHEDHLDMEF